MTEYWITLSVQVEARDQDEAQEIAKDLEGAVKRQNVWRLIGAEVTEIERVGDQPDDI